MGKFILSAFGDEIDPMLETQMDVLDRYGIKHIEMRGVNGKSLVGHTLEDVRELKKQMDARGFKVSSVASPIGKIKITEDFGPHLELFRHTIRLAQILETQYIRMFSFFIPEGEEPGRFRDEVLRRWKLLLEVADGSGLTLLHENEKHIYGDTPERCLDLLETLDCPYLKAVFDPANFVQCDVKAWPEAFDMLKEHIVYVHIKDALYKDYSVVPAGKGDGSVREILKELKNRGFEGFASLEPHLADFAGFSDLEPGSPASKLPEGGQQQFAVAYAALEKILAEI